MGIIIDHEIEMNEQQKRRTKPLTNADYIRAMTDEELAEFIAQMRFCVINPIADELKVDTTTAFIKCKENMTMWLKQGVEE